MGAELGPLGGVEAALEEGPEDGRLDPAPVEAPDIDQETDLRCGQAQDLGGIEETAVEPVDPFDPEHPAA